MNPLLLSATHLTLLPKPPMMGKTTTTHGGSALPISTHTHNQDHTSTIPDECLALIFLRLSSGDRDTCLLVCRRWLAVEGRHRRRLILNASNRVTLHLPAIFTRFNSLIELTLRCHRNTVSINDDALILISQHCKRLAAVKFRRCREVSHVGIRSLAQNCKSLRKFSCTSCTFGANGIESLINNSSSLQHLSVKRLRGGDGAKLIIASATGKIKSIKIKNLYSGFFFFTSLIIESHNLMTLKISSCPGSHWDGLLNTITQRQNLLTEIHLENVYITNAGLKAVSKCSNLISLHIAKAPDISDDGIIAIARNCKNIKKLQIEGCRSNQIGDPSLTEIGNNAINLKKLGLVGVSPSLASLKTIATNCVKLEILALCRSKRIGEKEIKCVAENFERLKKLSIKRCRLTDKAMEALVEGCPNLERMKVERCRGVSRGVMERLRGKRESLVVDLRFHESEETRMINPKVVAILFTFAFYLLLLLTNCLI